VNSDYQYPRDWKMQTWKQYCGLGRGAGKYRSGTGHHGYMTWNSAHFCAQEIFDTYRVFGDPVAEDAVRTIGHWCMAYVEFREKGMGLVAGTRADGLPFHNLCEKPFMMCQVIDGLRSYYLLTANERTLDQITGMLDFILDEGTIEKDGYIYGWTYAIELKKPREADRFPKLILPKLKNRKELGRKKRYKRKTSYTHLSPKFAWAHKYTGIPEYRIVIDSIDGNG
jgi:hypothetical protein